MLVGQQPGAYEGVPLLQSGPVLWGHDGNSKTLPQEEVCRQSKFPWGPLGLGVFCFPTDLFSLYLRVYIFFVITKYNLYIQRMFTLFFISALSINHFYAKK